MTSRSKVTWVKVKGHINQGQVRVPNKGRWAHDNVKLLHFLIMSPFELKKNHFTLLHVPCAVNKLRLDNSSKYIKLIVNERHLVTILL